jgi:hypothetical protein
VAALGKDEPFVGMCLRKWSRSLTTMDQVTLGLANKLLNKAQSTSFDAEAAALAERAYRLLANALNDHDSRTSSDGLPRKRERRHLRDRRSSSPADCAQVYSRVPEQTATYRRGTQWIELPVRRGQIDLTV